MEFTSEQILKLAGWILGPTGLVAGIIGIRHKVKKRNGPNNSGVRLAVTDVKLEDLKEDLEEIRKDFNWHLKDDKIQFGAINRSLGVLEGKLDIVITHLTEIRNGDK